MLRRILKDPNAGARRDSNYYLGLLLLVGASLSLVWAIWQEAFDPKNFLVYFLIYGWGYLLLFKSDTEFRLKRLEEEFFNFKTEMENLSKTFSPEGDYANNDLEDQPCGTGELFQELWGESESGEGIKEKGNGKEDG